MRFTLPPLPLYRTVRCERGLLTRADGSAQWTQGGTCCLASVTGPTQSYASSKEDAERATVDVVFRPRSGLAGALGLEWRACSHPVIAGTSAACCLVAAVYQALLHRSACWSPALRPAPMPTMLRLACPHTGALERQYEALIRRACEAVIVAALHPRALIQVVVQVS